MISSAADEADTLPTADDALLRAVRAEIGAPLTEVATHAAATTRGLLRPTNQDAWGHTARNLFVVADGMGGYAGGELAAATAVSAVTSMRAAGAINDWSRAIGQLNEAVRAAARAQSFDRAGTAIAIMTLDEGVATFVNVGDTRIYRVRSGRALQMTTDHTIEAELERSGIDSASPAAASAPPDALTRHIGAPTVEPSVSSFVPTTNDRFVIATDGVHRQLNDRTIARVAANEDPATAATSLIEAADRAGGRDNATAVVIDLRPTGSRPQPDAPVDSLPLLPLPPGLPR